MAIIDSSTTAQGTVVTLTGDVGIMEMQAFNASLGDLSQLPPQLMVLDMSGLTMLASCGIGALVAFRRAVLKAGGTVRLAAVRPLVAESLKRAAMHRLFEMHETVEAALAAPPTPPGPV